MSRRSMIIGTVVILLALGFLFFKGLDQSMMAYVEVSELHQTQKFNRSGVMQVVGIIQPGSVETIAAKQQLNFVLQDLNKTHRTIPVSYSGIIPDNFRPGLQVVVQGNLSKNQQVLKAQQILVKCPSKYETSAE